jgi:hypothetical protein
MPGREQEVRDAFLRQTAACEGLGSPFTARLCRLCARCLDETSAVGRVVLNWEGGDPSAAGDSVPLRLAGALHALVLSGKSEKLAAVYPPHDRQADDDRLWRAITAALERHAATILEWLKSAPQTNEVRRSAALLPGFMTIVSLTTKPLVLSEIGASAGLNLFWDRYAYRLGEMRWGDEKPGVVLAPEWTGAPLALPPNSIAIAGRAGCDLNPLDPGGPDDRLRLLAYIWADQRDRLDRTRAALHRCADTGGHVERASAEEWLGRRLQVQHAGKTHVVFHSIAWQYLPEAARRKGEKLLAEAGARTIADAPLAWLRLEDDGQRPGAALTLTMWPAGREQLIARADFHGRWVNWLGWRA